jgi:hypothetical protein
MLIVDLNNEALAQDNPESHHARLLLLKVLDGQLIGIVL